MDEENKTGLRAEPVNLDTGQGFGGSEPSEDIEPKRKRKAPTKAVPEDANRPMKMYRFTQHELKLVTSSQRDAARAMAAAAFFGGVALNTFNSFSFGEPNSDTIKGAWIALGVGASFAFAYYAFEAWRLRRKANADLEEIKNEHQYERDR